MMFSLKHTQIRALSLLVMPLLAGCAVGPNYHPTQAQVPSSWSTLAQNLEFPAPPPGHAAPPPDKNAPANANPPPPMSVPPPTGASTTLVSVCEPTAPAEDLGQWWTVFNDPMLSRLVSEGMQSNLDLKQARLRVLQTRAARGVIVSGLFPTVNYDGSLQTSRTPALIPKHGTAGVITNFFSHGLDATWELDFFGVTRRAIEGADAEVDSAVEDRRNVMVTLAGEIGSDYIALRGYQKELAIARENVIEQAKSVDLTEKKFKAGISNALDVANAKALVASTRATIPVLETAAQQQIYALGVLLGSDPAAVESELNKPQPIPPPPPTIPIGLPSDLIYRRPDIRSAQALVRAANAQIGVAIGDLFPKFALTGTAGFQGAKPSALVAWQHRFYAFGPTVDWSIFSAGKIQCNIQQQRIFEEEAEVTFHQTVLTALSDVDNATYAYAKEREHFHDLTDEVKAYQQVVTLSLKLYTDGSIDFLNVITAENSLFLAQVQLAQSEFALSIDVVAIYKALGGGWNDANVIECNRCCTLPVDPMAMINESK